MNILFVLIPASLLLGFFFFSAFVWALSEEQFDDLETPALRLIEGDGEPKLTKQEREGKIE